MNLRDEYWVLTRDTETGQVAKMTRLPVPSLEFYDSTAIPTRPRAMEDGK